LRVRTVSLQRVQPPAMASGSMPSSMVGVAAACCLLCSVCFLLPSQPRTPLAATSDVTQRTMFLERSDELQGLQRSLGGVVLGASACVALAAVLGTKRRAQSTKRRAFSGPYSLALPWAPVAEGLTNNPLDDTYVGDVGFDPLGFAKNKKLLPWYREAELAHGRACMLATLGISTQVAGGKWEPFITKYEVSSTDCLGAIGQVPLLGWLQIVLFVGTFETWRYRNVVTQYGNGVAPGDCGWNPAAPTASKNRPKWAGPTFTAKYSKEEFDDLRLKEIKHCRLAMLGFLGMVIENAATGSAPTIFPANIAGNTPDFAVTVGDFYTRQTPYAPPPM